MIFLWRDYPSQRAWCKFAPSSTSSRICLRMKSVLRLCHRAMEHLLEQQCAIKIFVLLGKNTTETYQMLQQAFRGECISRSQWGRWHTQSSPKPKRACISKSRIKTILIVFVEVWGMVYFELVPKGQTVSAAWRRCSRDWKAGSRSSGLTSTTTMPHGVVVILAFP